MLLVRRHTPTPSTRHKMVTTRTEQNQQVAAEYQAVSRLARYPFEPYWPERKLKICVTGG